MSEITTPRELFLHELGDILYVERALADETLPKLIGEVRTRSSATASRSIWSRRGSTSRTSRACSSRSARSPRSSRASASRG